MRTVLLSMTLLRPQSSEAFAVLFRRSFGHWSCGSRRDGESCCDAKCPQEFGRSLCGSSLDARPACGFGFVCGENRRSRVGDPTGDVATVPQPQHKFHVGSRVWGRVLSVNSKQIRLIVAVPTGTSPCVQATCSQCCVRSRKSPPTFPICLRCHRH